MLLTGILLEDVTILEGIHAKPSVVNDELVYIIPDWLIYLRQEVIKRDAPTLVDIHVC